MRILKSINVLVLSFVFLFAVACSGESKSTETVSEETVEVIEEAETTIEEKVDSVTTEIDSVMTDAVDSVSAEG